MITFVKMSSSPLGGVMGTPMVGKGLRGKVLIIVVDKYQNGTILNFIKRGLGQNCQMGQFDKIVPL